MFLEAPGSVCWGEGFDESPEGQCQSVEVQERVAGEEGGIWVQGGHWRSLVGTGRLGREGSRGLRVRIVRRRAKEGETEVGQGNNGWSKAQRVSWFRR